MTSTPRLAVNPGAIALMAVMAATRFDHFGSPIALPDASLAVFFLAGMWQGGRYLFIALLLEAGLIDYLAINQYGVSDFCISPAYVFLLPTYAVLWLSGRFCKRGARFARQAAMLIAATSMAFLISNGSFYLLSAEIADRHWAHYLEQFARYYWPYLASTLVYGVLLIGLVKGYKALLANTAQQQSQ